MKTADPAEKPELWYVEYQMLETRRIDGRRNSPVSPPLRALRPLPRAEAEKTVKNVIDRILKDDRLAHPRVEKNGDETVLVLFPGDRDELKLRYLLVKES